MTDTMHREAPATDEPATAWWWVKSVVSWLVLLVLASVLIITVAVPLMFGATPYTVLTGSMRPNYPPGSLIVVKPVAPDAVKGGDVITFQVESGKPGVITHRVTMVRVNYEGQRTFITQGDANNVKDENPIVPEQIRGKVWYSVPYLGYVNNIFTGDQRSLLIKIVVGGLLAYSCYLLISAHRDRGKDREGEADTETSGDQSPSATQPEGPTNVSP